MGKFAWVTLATNDSYSMGALVLAHSLRRVNTVHQLVVLITPGVTEAMKTQLSAVYNVVKLVDVLDSRDADNLALLARPELGITFTKLHCWKLTEYEKCVFLDADTLVLQNSDELFEREELSAAPDAGWPDCFNSGVFVYKPNQETFQALIEFALIHGSFDGGDQGLLNLFFSDWATKDIKKHLPFVYNMCSTATYSYLPAFKQFGAGLKIIHFIGGAKPWLQPFNTESGLVSVSGESQHLVQFVQLWWDTFCAYVHPTLSTEMAGLAGALATVTLGAPITVEQRALEEHLRRQGWEQGNIDYMGKDSFANIWQKICETLGAPAAPPEDAPAPVAPVAAPVYVSSVEISPTGQIDKTPPQANYAPVSVLKPTVEVSDSKDATKAPQSETAPVVPEPNPSVTEVVSTEASVTPSATLETSTPVHQVASEPPAAQQPATPVESAEKTRTAPATSTESFVTPAAPLAICAAPTPVAVPAPTELLPSTPSVPAPAEAPVTSTAVPTETPVLTPAPAEAPVPSTAVPTETPVLTPVPAEAPGLTPTAPTPTEATVLTPPASTPSEAPVLTPTPTETPVPSVPTPTEAPVPSVPTPTEAPVSTTPAPILPETPVLTPVPTEVSISTPSAPIPSEAPVSPAPAPTKVPASPDPILAPQVAPVPSTPSPTAPVSTPAPVEAQISSSPAPTATETPALTPSAPAPVETVPPTPPVSPASVPIPTEPSAPVPTPTSESVAPTPKAEPAQPQTPIVTEPTPPTSPPVAGEAPHLAKLQVEADVPVTPPAGGSTQPSLEGAAGEEPPVPPKRKGGSKAQQDSKNQKGGKPSKGKK